METTTIIGIVFAVIMIMLGLFWMFKKPNDAAPSLESALQFNEESQKPIIPRHVRDQLQVEVSKEQARVEPVLDSNVLGESSVERTEPVLKTTESHENAETSIENVAKPTTSDDVVTVDDKQEDQSVLTVASKAEEGFSLNSNINKAEIAEFNEESSILDAHLYEQKIVDDECALVTAESFIAFNIVSKNRVLSGDKTLKVLLKYGLRFGEMKCFHRYNDDGSKLLFSVLKLTDDGTEGFDLETLSTEEVKGLACFLALPHSDVQNAFDTMVSISGLIAREISGAVYDQDNFELTPQLREYWRHQAIDYKSGTMAGV